MQKAVANAGYAEPTPVQARAIPAILAGKDIIASANTGTGKTAAFVLPALQKLAQPRAANTWGPRILVLSPTRELATQILDAVRKYSKFDRVNTGVVLGGMPYREQLRMLQRRVDLLVATPGRLIDHLERNRVDLSAVEMLVLDEADRMLDMGFIDPVEQIAAACPAERQTVLFTATVDQAMTRLASRLLKSPERIDIAGRRISLDAIDQRLLRADDLGHKHRLLDHLVSEEGTGKTIVFAATKRDADRLAGELSAKGHSAGALHGDMKQSQRSRTIDALRKGRIRLLVATDVAARGIDVADITHVINFDLPKIAEDYIHRIGRTGRAGASGKAYSMYTGSDWKQVKAIEAFIGQSLATHVVPGLEPTDRPRRPYRSDGGPRRFSGERRSGERHGADRPRGDRGYGDRPHGDHPARSDRVRGDGGFTAPRRPRARQVGRDFTPAG
ncbi:MAG TPA: DEAD/DEAH box helicase [Arenibaculum sp.]|nr:DEAD/DEAH box helicase [Arenibaculum sp.]